MSKKNQDKKAEILQALMIAHKRSVQSDEPYTYTSFRKSNPALCASLERIYQSFSAASEIAGIQSLCHSGRYKYGETLDERRKGFTNLVRALVETGELNTVDLNDNSMNSSEVVNVPVAVVPLDGYKECLQAGCRVKLSKRSIYAQGRRLFSNWELALGACEFNAKEILRKTQSFSLEEIIVALDDFDKKRAGTWFVRDLRELDEALWKRIINLKTRKGASFSVPFLDRSDDVMFVAWVNLQYFRQFELLQDDEEWWLRERDKLSESFEAQHRSQESWDDYKIIEGIQSMFANLNQLTRSSAFQDDAAGKTWVAMRQKRFRESGMTESAWLRSAGFIPEKLSELYTELSEPYTTKIVFEKFAELMKKSLENQENCLTRDYAKMHEPDFHNAIIRKYGSWEFALKNYGLNPDYYSLTASVRARRGLIFQRFFRSLLIRYGFEEVERNPNKNQFVHNKRIEQCTHRTKCHPDFVFDGLIIDTKTGYHASQKPDQLRRYSSHCSNLMVLTLNDSEKEFDLYPDVKVVVMGFSELISSSNRILGITINLDESRTLTEVINSAGFWNA